MIYWILVIVFVLWTIRTSITMINNRETFDTSFWRFVWLFFLPLWYFMEITRIWDSIDKFEDWKNKFFNKPLYGEDRKSF